VLERRVDPPPAIIEQIIGVPAPDMEVAFLKAPGHTIELLHFRNVARRRRSELGPPDSGFFHLAFIVEDIDAVLRAAEPFGVIPIRPTVSITEGERAGWRICYTRDGDGTVIEFAQVPEGADA
jgi:catechol 2,3-dioxygenase-like lactoylglutathione lyase family enzyme